jgi:polyhydroxyalkanoate synthesis regulator phasin
MCFVGAEPVSRMAEGTSSSQKRASAAHGRRRRSRRSGRSKADGVTKNVAAVRELVMRSVIAPVNAVLLTRRHIEEVIEDAVTRGRMTRDDAQQMLQSLLQRGARQTDDFLSDLERLLGRSRPLEDPSRRSRKQGRKGSRRAAAGLPIPNYDDLSAAAVQERLDGLTPAELRKLRDYERRHANRKTVLDPINRKLR